MRLTGINVFYGFYRANYFPVHKNFLAGKKSGSCLFHRDLVVFVEKTEADSTGEYKKAAVLEALRVGLDGTDIQGISLDAAPAVIDAVPPVG